jgi:dTDP-glucose 4,6-dehydratase
MLKRKKFRVINVDALTYAGNVENLADIKHDPQYVFVRADIADAKKMEGVFKKYRPEYVINFAAETHVDRSIHSGANPFLHTNIGGVLVLLDCARRYPVKKFLQVSTDEVYGSLSLESTERFNETWPLAPNSPYAASKASAELFCRAYMETFKVPVVITRCSNNFGPYHNPEKLIPFLVLRAVQGASLPIYGDGKNVRDWIYVEDHCAGLELALFNGKPGEAYNIGADGERSNLEIAQRIADYFKLGKEALEFVADRPGHDRRYAIDSSKIRRELGWKPQANFDKVFEQTIAWYAANIAWAKRVFKRSGIFHPHKALFETKKIKSKK